MARSARVAESPSAGLIGFPGEAGVEVAVRTWRSWLADEKRASAHTCAAYDVDLLDFLSFLTEHLGRRPSLDDLRGLRQADFRAWLARRTLRGLARSSTARALSALRSFYQQDRPARQQRDCQSARTEAAAGSAQGTDGY